MENQTKKETKNITIADVAEALGVSKTTVSRAISGKGRIGQETRARVMDYIREHGYMPNAVARGLAQSKTYNLCVVMPDQYEVADITFFQDCMLGIEKIAATQDYDILLSVCSNENIASLERIVSNQKADGVILMRTYVEDAQIRFLKSSKLPFVAIGSSNEPEVVQVDHDHRHACMELTSLLLMKGCRRIALIGSDITQMVNHMRMGGFCDAHDQFGMEVDENLVRMNLENSVLVSKAVREITESGVDAILCSDDAVTAIVVKALNELGIRVPDDIKLASFYGGPLLSNSLIPISTIRFEATELGMVSCRVLLDQLEGLEVERCTRLPYEVVLKESTQS